MTQRPGLALVAVLVLALGISGNTAIFSALQAVAIRSLPYEDPAELVMVWESEAGRGATDSVVPASFFAWRAESRSFERLAGYFPFVHLTVSGSERPEEVMAASVTGDFFATLGREAALGRVFTADAASEELTSVVLGDAAWGRFFARDPRAVGKELRLDGRSYEVLGVMPPTFRFPDDVDLWLRAEGDLPDLPVVPDRAERMEVGYMRVLGRLRPDASLERAGDELSAIQHERDPGRGVTLVPLREHLVGDVRPMLALLMGAVALVLLIACGNVANLLLVRGAGRSREVAVRMALGADRSRVVRQVLAESVLLALAAGVLGTLLAVGELAILVRLMPRDVLQLDPILVDGRVLAFTLLLSLATAVVCGLFPALHGSRPDLVQSLEEGARSTLGKGPRRTQSALLVWEIAMTLILLIGSSLLLQSFWRLQKVDPGFDTERLLTFKVNLPAARASDPVQMRQSFERLLERVGALPGVTGAAASLDVPFTRNEMRSTFAIAGRPLPSREEERAVAFEVVSPGYFRTLGIPLLRGRELSPRDASVAPGVAVVSETVAQRYWPDADPIGQRITYDRPDDPGAEWLSVVGVVGDVRSAAPDRAVRPLVYRPFTQTPWPFMTLSVRTRGEPARIVPAIHRAVAEIDPEQPIADFATLDEVIAASVAAPRFILVLVALFTVVATLLSAIGIYGVIAYTVTRRRSELGLRMAVGAERRAILVLVLRWGMRLSRWGILVGLAGALALNQVLGGILYGIEPTDLPTYLAASALFLVVALLANLIPALRASRLDPLVALASDPS